MPTTHPIYPHADTLPLDPPQPKHKRPIAICGAGAIVTLAHLPAYRMCNYNIAGIYDINRETAYKAAQQYDIPKVYGSIKEMVETSPSDVVYDLAIPGVAVESTLKQLPDGAPVLIQKPMGDNWSQTLAIKHLCQQKNLIASINFQLRYSPHMLITHALIQRGVLGFIHDIQFDIHVLQPWEQWPFLERSRVEVTYHSIHYVDAIRSIWGTPSGIYALSTPDPFLPRIHTSRSDILFDYRNQNTKLYDYTRPPTLPQMADESYLKSLFDPNNTTSSQPAPNQDPYHTGNGKQSAWYGLSYPHRHLSLHSHHSDRSDRNTHRSHFIIEGTQGKLICQMGLNLNYPKGGPDCISLYTSSSRTWYDIPLHGRTWMPHAFRGPMNDLQRYCEGSISYLPTHYTDAFETMSCVESAYRFIDTNHQNVSSLLQSKL